MLFSRKVNSQAGYSVIFFRSSPSTIYSPKIFAGTIKKQDISRISIRFTG